MNPVSIMSTESIKPALSAVEGSKNIEQLFSHIAPRYDLLNTILSLGTESCWRKKTVKKIQFSKETTFTVLDLCAGTLALSKEVLKQFPHAKIFAVDFSQRMLNEGLRCLSPKLAEHILPICADALSLPFANNSVDVVLCGYGLRNVGDLEKVLTEISRVLRPQGQFLTLEFFRPTRFITKLFFWTYAPIVVATLGRLISRHKTAYTYLRKSILNFVSTQEFVGLLHKKGFANMTVDDFLMGVSTCVTAQLL